MRHVCKLPYGMALYVNPDNGHPYIRTGRGQSMARPHEFCFRPEKQVLHRALLTEELKGLHELPFVREDREQNAIKQARMMLEMTPRTWRYEEALVA